MADDAATTIAVVPAGTRVVATDDFDFAVADGVGAAVALNAAGDGVAGAGAAVPGVAAAVRERTPPLLAFERLAAVAILPALIADGHAALRVTYSALAGGVDGLADVALEAAVVRGLARPLLSLLELAAVVAAAGFLIAE
jgi:hypothetical protein